MALDASRAGPAGVPVTWRWIGVLTVLLALSNPAEAHGPEMMTIDRLVAHTSTVPAIKGRRSELLVREKVPTAYVEGNPGSLEGKVVLFVHGGFSPATLAFDVQYRDYSWMEHLAYGGFAVFAMDMTGYGRSTRPLMDDPCNVDPRQQAMLVPRTLKAPCPPSYPFELVTSDSETDDIDAVVEFIRRLRKVERVTLIGWSGGGIRTGTYTARHPGKVDRHVIWASSNYARDNPDGPPAALPRPGAPITLQTREVGIERRWLADVKCDGQVEPGMPELIGALSLQADPVGAQWALGYCVRRPAPTGAGTPQRRAVYRHRRSSWSGSRTRSRPPTSSCSRIMARSGSCCCGSPAAHTS